MATPFVPGQQSTIRAYQAISTAGGIILRLGLIIPLAWIGIAKFTSAEAAAIMPLVSHQPLMRWVYDVFSVQAFSNVLGCLELLAALLIAIRPVSARLSAIGSGIAALLFVSTISFLFTTPDVVASSSLHVPLVTEVGGFLIKDVALLGAAVWTLGEALIAQSAKDARIVGDRG